MQDHTADQLHIERAKPQRPLGTFPHHGKCWNQKRINFGATSYRRPEFFGLGAKTHVGQRRHFGFERSDGLNIGTQSLNATVVGRPENLAGETAETDHDGPFRICSGKIPAICAAKRANFRVGPATHVLDAKPMDR